MANSIVTYTGDGVTRQFSLPFPYISRNDVKVFVNTTEMLRPWNWRYLNPSTIEFNFAPGEGDKIVIKRQTEGDERLVVYQNGAVLTEEELNLAFLQNFYLIQEVKEQLTNATEGALGNLTPDKVDELLDEILSDELAAELQQRISDIDTLGENLIDAFNQLNNEVTARLQGDATLQAQLSALAGSVAASVFVQPEPPVPGVDGVPDPLPPSARWYDSDDSNHPYLWDGEKWVDLEDPRIGQNAADISALQVAMANAEGDIAANAGAISALDVTVTSLGGQLTSIANDLTNLEARVADTESGVAGNASAINGLEARVTQAEGDIVANAQNVTALEARVTTAEGDIDGNASAITALTSRVAANEDAIDSHASLITGLQSDISGLLGDTQANASAISQLTTRVASAEGDIASLASDISTLTARIGSAESGISANAGAISALEIRVEDAEGDIASHASLLQGLQADLTNVEGDVAAHGSAISQLQTRVTSAEGAIASHSTSISGLQSQLTSLDGEVSANAAAVDSLESRVSNAEGTLSAHAQSISTVSTTVDGLSASVTTLASSVDGLSAQWGVSINVHGHIIGFEAYNGGTVGQVAIYADKFYIVDPGDPGTYALPFAVVGGVVYMRNVVVQDALIQSLTVGKLTTGTLNADINVGTGRIIWTNGVYMKAAGVGFGTNNQFIEWYGPYMPLSQCSEVNATYYLKIDGEAYFGGALKAGTLTTSAQTSSLLNNAEVTCGPFGSNGGTIVVTYSYTLKAQEWSDNTNPRAAPTATIVLSRKVGTGSEVDIATRNLTGSGGYSQGPEPGVWLYSATISGAFTYTDNLGQAQDRTFRLRLASRYIEAPAVQQNLSITAVEE